MTWHSGVLHQPAKDHDGGKQRQHKNYRQYLHVDPGCSWWLAWRRDHNPPPYCSPASEDFREEGLRALLLMVPQQLSGLPGLDDDPSVHKDQGVADLAGKAHLVSDHDHRHA